MGFADTNRTRVAGGLSLLALLLVTLSDFLLTDFWDRNAMLAGIVADVFVLIVGVAVVNEFLAARSRRQWRLVADYALIELLRSCRHVWIRLTEAIGVGDREQITRDALRELVRDTDDGDRTLECARAAADDPESRRRLYPVVAELAASAGSTLTGWAPVLVETPSATALNGYVALQALLAELNLALWEEVEGKRLTTKGAADPDWIGHRIRAIIHVGAEMEAELSASVQEDSMTLGREATVGPLS